MKLRLGITKNLEATLSYIYQVYVHTIQRSHLRVRVNVYMPVDAEYNVKKDIGQIILQSAEQFFFGSEKYIDLNYFIA